MDIVGQAHGGLADISVDNSPFSNVAVQDAIVHLRSDSSSNCVPTDTAPCLYMLEAVSLIFGPFSFSGVTISSAEFGNEAFIPLQLFPGESTSQANLPPNLSVDSTFHSDVGTITGSIPVQTDLVVELDLPNNILRLRGQITGAMEGHVFTANIDIRADAPLVNRPPVAVARSTPIVKPNTCTATVSLDGSGSSDPDGNIVSWTWMEGEFTVGSGAIVQIPRVATGTHTFTLIVTDAFGGQGKATVALSVEPTVKPVFTSSAPQSANGCANVVLVPPTVSHPCGLPTTVVSNAPSRFFAGRTLVRWTATDSRGNAAVFTQDVIVYLGDDSSCCPAGSRIIKGTPNNDVLTGTSGVDCILGLGAQDKINGNGGNDLISGGDGDDTISGGDGDDIVSGGAGQDVVHGDNGNDSISGNDGDDSLFGDAGDNRLEGGRGRDRLVGGIGKDSLFGGDDDDQIAAGAGDDFVDAGAGNDRSVLGEAGNDRILGGDGDDLLTGGDGNDSIVGGSGQDTCQGGTGSNTLSSCEVIQ